MTETTTYSQNATATAPRAEIRPPAIGDIRGGGKTFQWKGISAEYYGIMRFFGYIAGVVSDVIIDKQKAEKEALIDEKRSALITSGKSYAEADAELVELRKQKLPWDKNRVAKWETAFFSGLTLLYAYRDWKDMRRSFSGALAAEAGISASAVNSSHMWNTSNPIIQTAMKRFTYMQVARLGTDATFLHSLNAGLIGMAARITIERTLFNQRTSYDRLEKLFHDTQLYNFDVHSPGKLAKEFGNIVQQIQKDHERQPLNLETIQNYEPLFNDMAKATVEKKIGLNEAVYILGELLTKRLTLGESQKLASDVITYSLDGLRSRPKSVILVNQSKEIAQEAVMVQEADRQVESLPKTMSPSSFAEKFMGGKSTLDQGQRSFTQMAEHAADTVIRGA